MNTIINIGPREIHFSLDVELLHLVRRKNRRLKIPADYDASVVIKRMDGQMTFLKASVLDISNEGCRLGLNTLDPMVPSEGKIEGTLRLPTKQSVELQGEVRYHKTHPRSENKQVFGIQFGGMSPYTTSRVKGLILELQRELFLRVLE